jgi:adenosine deaminase
MEAMFPWVGVNVLSWKMISVNILVSTLGLSWHIVAELLGLMNPKQFDFFQGRSDVRRFRKTHDLRPVDECWIITAQEFLNQSAEVDSLLGWANNFDFSLRIFSCAGIGDFIDELQVRRMRSFIYRVVLKASELCEHGKLYLSLAGGRKTMSADMQEAGNLFGCDAMLHIIDIKPLPEKLFHHPKADFITEFEQYGQYFLPLAIHDKMFPSLVVSSGEKRVSSKDFPLDHAMNNHIAVLNENLSLLEEIEQRRRLSSQLFTNFISMTKNSNDSERGVFRGLYYLHPDTLRKLRSIPIGLDRQNDLRLLQKLPKSDLHSHLGGVLSASQILDVAMTEMALTERLLKDPIFNNLRESLEGAIGRDDFDHLVRLVAEHFSFKSDPEFYFHRTLVFIHCFMQHPQLFHDIIYHPWTDESSMTGIGIEAYQKLGDFQGSALLQSCKTITKAVGLYADALRADSVQYVEIRCSPYKYTAAGLTTSQVVDCIMDVMDGSGIEYRIICILGRNSSIDRIQESVKSIQQLRETNPRFKKKLAGVDLAGTEGTQNPAALRDCFMPFLRDCVSITIHAGETESVENIWEAVYFLSADRIGHGLRLLEKPELIDRFIDKNIGVEMCPSSNNQIVGYPVGYPLKEYMAKGLKVTVNTDNAGISRTSLSHEFHTAGRMCGSLSLWECLVLIRNSMSVAFVDAFTKKRLMIDFERKVLDLIESGGVS